MVLAQVRFAKLEGALQVFAGLRIHPEFLIRAADGLPNRGFDQRLLAEFRADTSRRPIECAPDVQIGIRRGPGTRLRPRARLRQQVAPEELADCARRRGFGIGALLLHDRLIPFPLRQLLCGHGAITLPRHFVTFLDDSFLSGDREPLRRCRALRLPGAHDDPGDEHDEHRRDSSNQRLVTARELL